MNSPLRIIQITDPHLFGNQGQRLLNVDTDQSLQGVVSHIKAHQPHIDLLLATGDIAQDGSVAAYQRFIDLTGTIDAPLLGLPGNHDQRENLKTLWNNRTQAINDLGGWRIVLLDSSIPDSNDGHLADDQLTLLKRAADEMPDRPVLVAVHHNPVPVGSQWLDTMRINNAGALFDILEVRPQVKGLLWGHVHQEFDAVHTFNHSATAGNGSENSAQPAEATNGAHQLRLLATPATCVQFKPHSEHFALDTLDPGYRWLDLHDDGSITTGVVRVAGLDVQPDAQSKGY